MIRFWQRISVGGLFLAVLVLGSAGGGRGDDFKPEAGFRPLFNGKDLTGWRYGKEKLDGKTETPDKRFTVADGVIVANPGKGIKDLWTVQDFAKDFHLKVEFRAAPRADSGVYIRGPQLQVRDFPTVGPYKNLKGFKAGDWNLLDITVRGGQLLTSNVNGKSVSPKDALEVAIKDGTLTAKLNGQPVDVGDLQVAVGAAAECRCNGEVLEKAFKVPAKGPIGLQAETGKFEFRHIRIKEMP